MVSPDFTVTVIGLSPEAKGSKLNEYDPSGFVVVWIDIGFPSFPLASVVAVKGIGTPTLPVGELIVPET